MWRYIEHIRKKPLPVRNLYAFWGAAVFTAIVVVIWSVSVPQRLLSVLQPSEAAPETSGRLWSGVMEYGADLRANLMGAVTGNRTDTVPSTTPGAYKIDLSTLEGGEGDNSLATSSEDRVWDNTPTPRSGGRVILIATTSRATSTKIDR